MAMPQLGAFAQLATILPWTVRRDDIEREDRVAWDKVASPAIILK